jgi:hypothetical protein
LSRDGNRAIVLVFVAFDERGVMSRFEDVMRVLVVVAATFLLTEWVHFRLGAPPIFEFLGRRGDSGVARGHDPDAVTESEFQTYLRVLEAMQTNRSMPIDDAVEAEHLQLEKFRELEQRVQRNEVLVDRARHELRERAETLWKSVGPPRDHG